MSGQISKAVIHRLTQPVTIVEFCHASFTWRTPIKLGKSHDEALGSGSRL
jgi:hypothetical protein